MQTHYCKYPDNDQQQMFQVGIVTTARNKPLSKETLACINSFNGEVGWKSVPDLLSANGCDVLFDEGNSNTLRIAFPAESSDQISGSLSVSVLTASDYPVLPSIIHTVLASAFVPGTVGIDWDDVLNVLRSGSQAFLAVVMDEIEAAINQGFTLLNSQLNGPKNEVVVRGALAVFFAPMGNVPITQINQTFLQLRRLVSDEQPLLVGVPHITDSNPIFALLVVTDSLC